MFFFLLLSVGIIIFFSACQSNQQADTSAVLSQPKAFVGSQTCKACHLEHYDSWQMTLHSRMLISVSDNPHAIIADMNPDLIRADLKKIEGKLKTPVDEVYIPDPSEILYVIGTQWKQRYIVKKDDKYHVAPVQYNVATRRWVNYHDHDWKERDWLERCGGCHATGVDLDSYTFSEPAIGCEACHGAGSRHAALPRTALFEKRDTIVNPAKLTAGVAVQICGSCHTRGNAKHPDYHKAGWPVGYEPGMVLEPIYESSYDKADMRRLYPDFSSRSHHQQYIDWIQSEHAQQGVTCTSCHSVHRLGIAPTRFQTKEAGSSQCLSCHTMVNANRAHSIHSFANCLGCHMPRMASTAEPNDIRNHTFRAGPAGISTAAALSGFGLEVLLLDEQPRPGGQIYKSIENASDKRLKLLGEDYGAGLKLVNRFRCQETTYVPGATVWQVETDGYVYYSKDSASFEVAAKFVVAATGAMERPVPFPGWTLPGVMGAGGAGNLIKDAGLVPQGKVILAGTGPLLFLEAVHLMDMGVDIRAILETTSILPHLSSLAHLPAAVRRMDFLKKGLAMLGRIKRAGIDHHKGVRKLCARGCESLESVHVQKGKNWLDFEADLLLTHFGVIPNTAIFRHLGCRHHWNDVQRYWYPESDKWGRTSHDAIFAAGDGGFVSGALTAALKGEMIALAISADMGLIHENERNIRSARIEKQLAKEMYPRPFIDALYAPVPDLYDADPETVVCRCENITMGQIHQAIGEGCIDPNEIKALLRPGMGACQGRMCGSALSEIISLRSGIDIKKVGTFKIRPPLKNISLHEIANIELCEG